MFNLVKAEIYRLFNRRFIYIFWGILIFLTFITISPLKAPINDLIALSKVTLVLPIFLWPLLTDAITCEEFKDNTYINTVTFGITRLKFFITKTIVSCFLVIMTVLIVVITWCLSASLAIGSMVSGELLINFFASITAALPLYLAAMLLSILLTFVFRKSSLALFSYWGIIGFSYFINIVQSFNSVKLPLYDALLTTQLTQLVGPPKMIHINNAAIKLSTAGGGITDTKQMFTAAVIGTAYIMVFILSGAFLNRKWK